MLPYFRECVDANQVAVEVSEDIKGVIRGPISIGCYFSVSSKWMPSLLKFFSDTYPSIQITLLEGGNKEIAKWSAEKSVDICLCAEPKDSGEYRWKELYRDSLVAWLPKNHHKAKQKTYNIKDLENRRFYPYFAWSRYRPRPLNQARRTQLADTIHLQGWLYDLSDGQG